MLVGLSFNDKSLKIFKINLRGYSIDNNTILRKKKVSCFPIKYLRFSNCNNFFLACDSQKILILDLVTGYTKLVLDYIYFKGSIHCACIGYRNE